jgi:predicted P-loop ATPase/GTPase
VVRKKHNAHPSSEGWVIFCVWATIASVVNFEGESMGNLASALQQLRAERAQAQSHVEKLDTAISVIESLNGSGTLKHANQPTRVISAASRRKMALAQRARWARAKNGSQPVAVAKTTQTPVKRTMSLAARRKIAAFQQARWAKLKAGKKAA